MKKLSMVAGIATALVLTMSGCADRGGDGGTNGAAGYTVDSPTSTAVLGTFDPLATVPSAAAPPARNAQADAAPVVKAPAAQSPAAQSPGAPPRTVTRTVVNAEQYRTLSQSGHDFAFITPSGNVSCSLSSGGDQEGMGCQARDTVRPENSSICVTPGSDRSAIIADEGRLHFTCLPPDSFYFDGQNVLAYGQTLSIGGITCSSDEVIGVHCTLNGTALTLSRDINRTY